MNKPVQPTSGHIPARPAKSGHTESFVQLSSQSEVMDRYVEPTSDQGEFCQANQRPQTGSSSQTTFTDRSGRSSSQLAATDRSIKPIRCYTDRSVPPTSGHEQIRPAVQATSGHGPVCPADLKPHRHIRPANQRPRTSPSSQSATTHRSSHPISGYAPQINVSV